MNQPFLQIFGLAIAAVPAALLGAFLAAVWLAERNARAYGLNGAAVDGALYAGGLLGLLGARAAYVAGHFDAYLRDPLAALALNASALDGAGFALAFAVVAGWRLHRAGLIRPALADALAGPGLVMAIGLALASWFEGSVFGVPSRLPWAVEVWGAPRHPVQVYEIVGFGLALVALWATRRRPWPAGARAALAVLLGSILLAAAEGLRADVRPRFVEMRPTQLAWTAVAAIAAWALGEMRGPPRDHTVQASTNGMSRESDASPR